jgi:hypothetical protein
MTPFSFGCLMPSSGRNKDLESLIVQSYVWALRAPRNINGHKVVSLARHGRYEVRLLEPSEMLQNHDLPFWLELFDSVKNFSIDSYAGDDVEEAAAVAQHLIARAGRMDQGSDF